MRAPPPFHHRYRPSADRLQEHGYRVVTNKDVLAAFNFGLSVMHKSYFKRQCTYARVLYGAIKFRGSWYLREDEARAIEWLWLSGYTQERYNLKRWELCCGEVSGLVERVLIRMGLVDGFFPAMQSVYQMEGAKGLEHFLANRPTATVEE